MTSPFVSVPFLLTYKCMGEENYITSFMWSNLHSLQVKMKIITIFRDQIKFYKGME